MQIKTYKPVNNSYVVIFSSHYTEVATDLIVHIRELQQHLLGGLPASSDADEGQVISGHEHKLVVSSHDGAQRIFVEVVSTDDQSLHHTHDCHQFVLVTMAAGN